MNTLLKDLKFFNLTKTELQNAKGGGWCVTYGCTPTGRLTICYDDDGNTYYAVDGRLSLTAQQVIDRGDNVAC